MLIAAGLAIATLGAHAAADIRKEPVHFKKAQYGFRTAENGLPWQGQGIYAEMVSMLLFAGVGAISIPTFAGEAYPKLNFVKEGKIPETEWLPYDHYLEDVEQARAEWSKIRPMVEQQLTFATIKEHLGLEESDLGFAGSFRNLGALISDSMNPFAHIDKGGGRRWLVFEGAYGPLRPSIPLVVRWIKTYITYDTVDKRIIRVTMTIEGQKFE